VIQIIDGFRRIITYTTTSIHNSAYFTSRATKFECVSYVTFIAPFPL